MMTTMDECRGERIGTEDDETNVRKKEVSIKGCHVEENGVLVDRTSTATATASVCFTGTNLDDRRSTTMDHSIVHHNPATKEGLVISQTDDAMVEMDGKVNCESSGHAELPPVNQTENDSSHGEKRTEITEMDDIDQCKKTENGNNEEISINEDIIDGFAFVSFNTYDDLEVS